jgi:hypothetical protein
LSVIDSPENLEVETYEGVNRLISNRLPVDNLDFYNSLMNLIKDKENYDDCTLNKFVVTFINSIGINSISNCNSINELVNNLNNQLLGNRVLIKPNINIISENLLIIPKIIDKLDTDYFDILQSILIDCLNNTNNLKDDTSLDDIVSNVKKFILSSVAINDSIFDILNRIAAESFDIIHKIQEM